MFIQISSMNEHCDDVLRCGPRIQILELKVEEQLVKGKIYRKHLPFFCQVFWPVDWIS